MEMGRIRAFGAGVFRRIAVHLGFWQNGTRDARAVCSSPETGSGGVLSIRKKPDVCWLSCRLDGLVGSIWQVERRGAFGCAGCHSCRGSVCEVLRGADAPKNFWRGL